MNTCPYCEQELKPAPKSDSVKYDDRFKEGYLAGATDAANLTIRPECMPTNAVVLSCECEVDGELETDNPCEDDSHVIAPCPCKTCYFCAGCGQTFDSIAC